MAIRFMNTEFYKSPFVRSLKGPLKSLYSFIICDCNGAGIWVKDLQIASAYIDFDISDQDFQVFIEKNKAIDLNNGKYFFPDFIEHQYPKGLQRSNPAHKNFIIELEKYGLIDENLKPLDSPSQGAKVMVKVIVEEKVKEENEQIEKIDAELSEGGERELFRKMCDSPGFIKAWEAWVEYRRERRQSLKGPKMKAGQIKRIMKLSKGDVDHAIALIENAIELGWQGIFPIKDYSKAKKALRDQHGFRQG